MSKNATIVTVLIACALCVVVVAGVLVVFSSHQESERRELSLANVQSITQGMVTMAMENKGRYRLNSAAFNDADMRGYTHYGNYDGVRRDWREETVPEHFGADPAELNAHLYLDMLDFGLLPDHLACPSRGPESLRENPDGSVELGYYILAGHDQQAIDATGLAERVWHSPNAPDDAPDLPTVTSILQYNSDNDPPTSYPHGPRGLITFSAADQQPAEDSASVGGAVAYNDGSVNFVFTADSTRFSPDPTHPETTAWWSDSPNYDSVNESRTAP